MLMLASQLFLLLGGWNGFSNSFYKTSNRLLQDLTTLGVDDYLNPSSVKQLYKYNRQAFEASVKGEGIFFTYQTHVFTLKKIKGRYSVAFFNLDTEVEDVLNLSQTAIKRYTNEGGHRDVSDVMNGLLKVLA